MDEVIAYGAKILAGQVRGRNRGKKSMTPNRSWW